MTLAALSFLIGQVTLFQAYQDENTGKSSADQKKATPMSQESQKLDGILDALKSEDVKVRQRAMKSLNEFGLREKKLSTAQGVRVLHAAAGPFSFSKSEADEISEELLMLLSGQSREEYIPVILDLFGQFSEKGRSWALVILAELKSQKAAEAYMQIIRKHGKQGRISSLPTGPLEKKPRHAKIFFPELLEYVEIPKISSDIYRLTLAYAQAGLLSPEILSPFSGTFLKAYQSLDEKLRPAQRREGIAWMWEEKYQESRYEAEPLLDLLGFFPAKDVESALRRALEIIDPRLKYFAISSLLRLHKVVPSKDVADVAAHPEMRNWLYDKLKQNGNESLFPKKWLHQAAFAESDMVHWLIFPTELDRAPDEIELMKVVSVETGLPDGIYDYYLFRFRTHKPHWAAKDGWMAGVSGPFLRKDQPTTNALGETFSTFKKWESKKPDEHVGDMRELMERWREYHSKKKQ